MEVNAIKTVSINQLVHQVINPGQWVLIRSCPLVWGFKIYAYSESTISVLAKRDGVPIRRGARPNPALVEVLI